MEKEKLSQSHLRLIDAASFALGTLVAKMGYVGAAQEWLAKAILASGVESSHCEAIVQANNEENQKKDAR
jgi:hypothetical protein